MSATANDLLADGTVTVDGARAEFGIGRTRLFEMMKCGRLPYSQLGSRRLIPRRALRQLIATELVNVATSAETPAE